MDIPFEQKTVKEIEHIEFLLTKQQPPFKITKKPNPKRKDLKGKKSESSLKFICLQLLKEYHNKKNAEIHLNDFSKHLGVERRRIYDIVNILEGFDLFAKKMKNIYIWKGLDLFTVKLRLLEALDAKNVEKVRLFQFEKSLPVTKKKSLTVLALRFLKALCGGERDKTVKEVVTSFAEEEGDKEENKNGKNKIRRLYDIINVFKAMGLIIKKNNDSGKGVYFWMGSIGLAEKLENFSSGKDKDLEKKKEEESLDEGRRREGFVLETSGFDVCGSVGGLEFDGFKKVILSRKESGLGD